MPDDPDDLARVGAVVLGRYAVDGVLGRGGLSVVFAARDVSTGERVAVKALRHDLARVDEVRRRFLREARIALRLSHPAVCRGVDVGEDVDGTPLLVMERLDGEDLATRVARDGRLELRDALTVGARVADALAAAHAVGVVHRDIKPANVMLLREVPLRDAVRVVDFGLAHCLDEPRLTATNGAAGTPEYMSPEQVRGEPVSPRSDLYALGATLVELLSGETLYAGGTLAQMHAHHASPVPDLRARVEGLPDAVDVLLRALLEKDPDARPGSAGAVRDALDALTA